MVNGQLDISLFPLDYASGKVPAFTGRMRRYDDENSYHCGSGLSKAVTSLSLGELALENSYRCARTSRTHTRLARAGCQWAEWSQPAPSCSCSARNADCLRAAELLFP